MADVFYCKQLYEEAYDLHYHKHRFNEAVEIYKQIIDQYPDSPEAGYSKTQIGNIEKMSDMEKQRYASVESSGNNGVLNDTQMTVVSSESIPQSQTPTFSLLFNALGIISLVSGIYGFISFLPSSNYESFGVNLGAMAYYPSILSRVSGLLSAFLFWALSSVIRRLQFLEDSVRFLINKK